MTILYVKTILAIALGFFAGLGVVYIARNWKIAIAPVLLMLILFIAIPSLGSVVSIMVPVGVVFTLIVSRILYKKGLL